MSMVSLVQHVIEMYTEGSSPHRWYCHWDLSLFHSVFRKYRLYCLCMKHIIILRSFVLIWM